MCKGIGKRDDQPPWQSTQISSQTQPKSFFLKKILSFKPFVLRLCLAKIESLGI